MCGGRVFSRLHSPGDSLIIDRCNIVNRGSSCLHPTGDLLIAATCVVSVRGNPGTQKKKKLPWSSWTRGSSLMVAVGPRASVWLSCLCRCPLPCLWSLYLLGNYRVLRSSFLFSLGLVSPRFLKSFGSGLWVPILFWGTIKQCPFQVSERGCFPLLLIYCFFELTPPFPCYYCASSC